MFHSQVEMLSCEAIEAASMFQCFTWKSCPWPWPIIRLLGLPLPFLGRL